MVSNDNKAPDDDLKGDVAKPAEKKPECLGPGKCKFVCAAGFGGCLACGYTDEPGGGIDY